jgi:hypothetical protein
MPPRDDINTSEDNADEASYGQQKHRYKGSQPKPSEVLSTLIGLAVVFSE